MVSGGRTLAVVALLAAAVVVTPAPTATAAPALPVVPPGLCAGLLTVILPTGPACTHGPDPAPRRALAASAEAPGTAAATSGGGAVPCSGDGVSGNRVTAIYAHATGTADNYSQVLASIRGWAADVDRNYANSAAQMGGVRHVVWATTGCVLDVADVTVSQAAVNTSDPSVWAAELENQGYNRGDRKYLVWMDATVICGIATSYPDERPTADNPNNGGQPMFGRIDRGCWGGVPAGLQRSIETHELTHTLGAVLPDAPHHVPSGHCFDGADVMCQQQSGDPPVLSVCPAVNQTLLDCNHDDYFSLAPPSGTFLASNWNTANSSFLASVPAASGAPPMTSSVSPASGATGSAVPVTITGSGFHPSVFVQLERAGQSPIEMSSPSVTGTTQISGSFDLTLKPTGAYSIRVINLDDSTTGTTANAFTVLGPAPVVSGVAPGAVLQHQSAAVTVTGANFTLGDVVSFGSGVTVTNVVVTDASHLAVSLTGTVPGHHDLVVTDSTGRSASCARCLVVTGTDPSAFGYTAYPGFGGGATVASGDLIPGLTGDEVVTGAGPGGGPDVEVSSIDPATGVPTRVAGFFAYDAGFTGGVRVAVGELDGNPGDGKELVTAPGPGGGPDVRVWKVAAGGAVTLLYSFMAYDPGFTGGVNVAAGDVIPSLAGDEIVTGAGAGGGPDVRVFNGSTPVSSFYAYDPGFTGGLTVAVGHFGTFGPLILTGAGAGGGPDVEIFTGTGGRFAGFFPYDTAFRGGVSVAAGNVDGQPGDEVITGAGPGGGPDVRVWRSTTQLLTSFLAFGSSTVGVRVAAGDTDDDGHAEVIAVPWTGGPVLVLGHRV